MARVASSELFNLRVVRELGIRTPGTYLVKDETGEHDHVVLETYANLPPKTVRDIDATARRMATLMHPHVVSVVGVERISGGVCVLTEFIEGVPVDEIFFKLSLKARLRVIVDLLGALSELHAAPGGPPIVHAGVLARSAFVTRSGATKLGFAYRAPLCLGKDAVAPESLLADEADLGPHTDVYSAGVMLWEAIAGRTLFGDEPPEGIIAAQLANQIPALHVSQQEPWASALVPIVEKALATDPSKRFQHVATMTGELRLAVRARLCLPEVVAAQVWAQPGSGVQSVQREVVAAQVQSDIRMVSADPIVVDEPEPEPELEPEPPPRAKAKPQLDSAAIPIATPPPTSLPSVAPPVQEQARAAALIPPRKSNAVVWAGVVGVALVLALALAIALTLRASSSRSSRNEAAPQQPPPSAHVTPSVRAEPERVSAPSSPPSATATSTSTSVRRATSASATTPPAPAPANKRRRPGSYNPSSI